MGPGRQPGDRAARWLGEPRASSRTVRQREAAAHGVARWLLATRALTRGRWAPFDGVSEAGPRAPKRGANPTSFRRRVVEATILEFHRLLEGRVPDPQQVFAADDSGRSWWRRPRPDAPASAPDVHRSSYLTVDECAECGAAVVDMYEVAICVPAVTRAASPASRLRVTEGTSTFWLLVRAVGEEEKGGGVRHPDLGRPRLEQSGPSPASPVRTGSPDSRGVTVSRARALKRQSPRPPSRTGRKLPPS